MPQCSFLPPKFCISLCCSAELNPHVAFRFVTWQNEAKREWILLQGASIVSGQTSVLCCGFVLHPFIFRTRLAQTHWPRLCETLWRHRAEGTPGVPAAENVTLVLLQSPKYLQAPNLKNNYSKQSQIKEPELHSAQLQIRAIDRKKTREKISTKNLKSKIY